MSECSYITPSKNGFKMVEYKSSSFDRPIPGMSLTAELGNRPWQQPPQYSTDEKNYSGIYLV